MRELFHTAATVQAFCRQNKWKYCFIGGIALQAHGEVRETINVDLTILTGFGGEERFIDELLATFRPRRPDAASFAIQHRILLVATDAGVGIDISLGAHAFELAACDRAIPFTYPGPITLDVVTAEDLIVMKAIASRPRDWLDIEGVIIKQTGKLNWQYILSHTRTLAELKEEPQIVDHLLRRRDEFEK